MKARAKEAVVGKILLVLKTPPPYGGGEVRALALKEHVRTLNGWYVLEMSSHKRNKGNQNKFEFWKIAESFKNWIRFTKESARIRPTLVYISLSKYLFGFLRDNLLIWTCRILGIKIAGEVAGSKLHFMNDNKMLTRYTAHILKKLVSIRLLGQGIAKTFEGYGISNTVVFDNGVSVPTRCSYQYIPNDGIIKLLFVGTLSRQKGVHLLIDAAIFLIQEEHPIEVHFLGEWGSAEFKESIEHKIFDFKSRFHFHGVIVDEKKWFYFSQSQIFILPSLLEGQPLTIIEALGCGIPVVASNVGAVPEMIENGCNGFIVDNSDAISLTNALKSLITDAELRKRMSEANIKLYNARFSHQIYLANMVGWLRNCAKAVIAR
jgi:glycosyltransferase involved in cell wall biosynthesis